MTIVLPTLPGLTPSSVHNIPDTWDKTWYNRHIRDFLQWADVRNSVSGPGIAVTGDLRGPATISLNGVGTANSTFGSGDVLYWQSTGPGGLVTANQLGHSNNLIFGTNIPLPSAKNGPALLLGSGGGNGTPVEAWILTDQAFDNVTNGNTLGIAAGETQPAGTADGGLLWLFGGASWGGKGGELRVYGGTSHLGPGGTVNILGGSGGPAAAPGDVIIGAGQTGNVGASVRIAMSSFGGVSGFFRIQDLSNPLIDFMNAGQMFLYGGNGFGLAGQPLVSAGPSGAMKWQVGFTGTRVINAETYTWSSGILISIA